MRRAILYLGSGNSARSQMAEGLTRQYFPDDFDAYSAGIAPAGVHPFAILVMQEMGIDISSQFSKSIAELPDIEFDVVVTLCEGTREACPAFHGKAQRFHFGFPDPAAATGDSDRMLNAFQQVRDQIREHLIPVLERLRSQR
jgi:arsenate reductase